MSAQNIQLYTFNQQYVIKTLTPKNSNILLQYYLENQQFFKPFVPFRPPQFFTLAQQQQNIKNKQQLLKKGTEYRFFVFETHTPQKIIADFALSNIIKGAFWSCHLGYCTHYDYVNKGIITQVLKTGIEFAFQSLQLHRLEANVMPHNYPSIKVLQKLNFNYEGYAPKYLKIDGKWQDHLHFTLLNPNCPH